MDNGEGQKPNYKDTVGKKQDSNWQRAKRWLAGGAVAGAVVGGSIVGAHKIEQNSQDQMFGQPVTGEVQDASVIASSRFKTEGVSDIDPSAPIFRKSPDQYSDEYSKEELQEMGVDVTGDVKVEKVWGKPYASDLSSAQVTDEKSGITRGVWGEIMAPDPENPGKYKGTGIYLSENFFSIDKPENTTSSSNPNENQNLNQRPSTTSSQESH